MSTVNREYTFLCGQQGKDSYDNGTAHGSIKAVLMYYFSNEESSPANKQAALLDWASRFRSLGLMYVEGEWYFNLIIYVNTLSSEDLTLLDNFIENNKSVLGRYPPRLLNPDVTFTIAARTSTNLGDMSADLIGRGMDAGLALAKGDDVELWYDHALSSSEENRIVNMWANRLVDPNTGNPL